MTIEFKNPGDEPDLEKLHPRLKTVIDFMEAYARIVLKRSITVTRIVEHDGSTHDQKPPYRFIDVRSLDMPKSEAEKMRTIVNLTFPYGLTSKGLPGSTIPPLDHKGTVKDSTAEHFHVQVSARKAFG